MQEKICIPSTKGEIAAVAHYPQTNTGILAILCPGNLDSKDYPHLVELAEDLCAQGYTAVRFDPTGTWESNGNISDYTNTQYLSDIKSVLEYMLHEGGYTHILLGGHSRGGQISILYAARDPRISIVAGIMPSTPLTHRSKRTREEQWRKDGVISKFRDEPRGTGKREFRIPFSHVVDRDKYNVLEDVKKVHVPLILIAGEKDVVVPPEHVREIFENANEPKKFILVPRIGHDYRFNQKEIKTVNTCVLSALPL